MTSRKKLIIYNWLSSILSDFGVFRRFRKSFLRWSGVDIHPSVFLSGTVRFVGEGEISIGAHSTIREGALFHVAGGGRITLGEHVLIGENAILECGSSPENTAYIKLGNHVDFMMGSLASACGSAHICIENNCKIAHNVSIKSTEHKIDLEGECIGGEAQFHSIHISTGCWVCAGAIIIPGVTVGKYNIIAAGAVVIHDTPDNVLMAGVPATVKKEYQRV